jgi:fatty-acyl-CoA synthase
LPNASTTLVSDLFRAADAPDEGLRILEDHQQATWLPWPLILERALVVCGRLQRLGVARGDRVSIIFPTCPQFFDAFFGVLLSGAIPVPLYPPLRLGRLVEYQERTSQMIRVARSRLVLADRRVRHLLAPALRTSDTALGCLTLEDLPDGSPEPAAIDPDDLGLIQFSSGTTNEPKATALTHGALCLHAATLNAFWPDSEDVHHSGVTWLPLYHDMGLIGCLFTAMERPATLTLIPPERFVARPAVWLQTISKYRATVSPAPNFAYNLCVKRVRDEEMAGVDLSCWRVALDGAEMVVPEVIRAFQRRFGPWGFRAHALTPVYGLSEASLAVTFSDIDAPPALRRFDRQALEAAGIARQTEDGRELASVGRPVPGVTVRIVDDRGSQLTEGRVGRIECRGPSLMSGYFGQAAATAQVLHDGWLDTGDLGFVSRGELFITGRTKDMLLLRGRNYSPDDLERAVDALPDVRTGCVVAVSWLPEGADGERLLVLVEARRGFSRAKFPVLAKECAATIITATGLAPDQVVVLEPGTLPRTSSGKLRRRAALQQYLAGRLAPPQRFILIRVALAVARSWITGLQSRRTTATE